MGSLGESRAELEHVLERVEHSCHEILNAVDKFGHHVGNYALVRLSHKLITLAAWVTFRVRALREEHQGQGYVCVFLNEWEGLNALWVEDEELVADKAYYKARGSIVLTLDEVSYLLFDLTTKLNAGSWLEVVDWIRKYGRSPGLDFNMVMVNSD